MFILVRIVDTKRQYNGMLRVRNNVRGFLLPAYITNSVTAR